jgi:fructose-specific PTS system IIA-like component
VRSIAQNPGATRDGQALDVAINATTAKEVAAAVTCGAQGVGLLRTELLFLDRDAPPTEDEQFEAYVAVVRAAQPHPVIIRTFDIGGDKPATYMSLPREDNPFLGVRGARLYPAHAHLLHTQLRAILRTSSLTTQGAVRIMAPMISVPAEAAWFREQVEFVKAQLSQESIAHDRDVPVGMMIEVPSAAMDIARLAKHADFFSVGTNDLSQYWFAADRGNPHIASMANVHEPSFLRVLHAIASQARDAGKWVGVCGEMASDIRNLPIWIGAGFHEISVAPSEVAALKASLAALSFVACREALNRSMQCDDAASAAITLAQSSHSSTEHPVVIESAIHVHSTASTKHEAIREAADLMLIAGRTQNPDDIERAAWQREATYSTSLGFGFAIPHCKTEAVQHATLSVLKLSSPITWSGDADVSIVILLAVPAHDTTGTHMRVFAKLARKLMHEEFRLSLSEAATPQAIAQLLHAACGS